MVELEPSSPAHTRVESVAGLLNTAFFVSNLEDEPAMKVWTGEQEQTGTWAASWWALRLSSIRTQRKDGLVRPASQQQVNNLAFPLNAYPETLLHYTVLSFLRCVNSHLLVYSGEISKTYSDVDSKIKPVQLLFQGFSLATVDSGLLFRDLNTNMLFFFLNKMFYS